MPYRVSIPVTIDVGWVLSVPELCVGETRPASEASLRELEDAFEPCDDADDDTDWFELLARYAFVCGTADQAE